MASKELLTEEVAKTLPAAVRKMLKSQCDGEWGRVMRDEDGSFMVFSNLRVAMQRAGNRFAVSPITQPKTRTIPTRPKPPAERPVERPKPVSTQPVFRPPVAKPAAPSTRREKSAEAAALQRMLGSESTAAKEPVTTKIVTAPKREPENPYLWTRNPMEFDWSKAGDLEGTASRLRDRLRSGLPEDMPIKYFGDVLALWQGQTEDMEAALHHPHRVEIRPETTEKQYPILAFYRGDIIVILGMRTPHEPMVIAVYLRSKLPGGDIPMAKTTSGGGGARKTKGLPTSIPAMIRAIRDLGCQVPDLDPTSKVAEVTYKGQVLGKVTVEFGDKKKIQSDYQRVARQVDGINRRMQVSA